MNKEDLEKERFKLHQALCERNETIEELQQRIDKAIEYINEYQNIKAHKLELDENGFKDIIDFGFKKNMLSILEGEDNV